MLIDLKNCMNRELWSTLTDENKTTFVLAPKENKMVEFDYLPKHCLNLIADGLLYIRDPRPHKIVDGKFIRIYPKGAEPELPEKEVEIKATAKTKKEVK